MCTTIRTKHHSCGHTQYQNTSHCHVVRRLQSSSHLPLAVDENVNRNNYEALYPPQGQRGLQICQPSSSHPRASPSPTPDPQLRSRDDHRLLLQSTKWLPDPQPRVPPGMFQCVQNVATRPVEGLCKQCQKQQARNLTPRPRTTTPVATDTPSQQYSPQVQSKKEGKAKLHKKNKKSEPPSSLLGPTTNTTTTTLSPSAAAAIPVPGNRTRSTSTATTGLTVNEKSPSRSLTPASMFRRAMQRDRASSATPSLDVDLTRTVRDSFQKLSLMYGSGTPEPGRSRSVSAVSVVPEEGKDGNGADAVTDTTPYGKKAEEADGSKGGEDDKGKGTES
ncbi:hypothetical protein PG993_007813 [Apiospora rasikravindrae]|uniref:Uncharacterized protein n=1 Tax=Apiospora rasikravindrae TaxID=990691 RepID=A0ABR1SYJ7_9PEZI